ncbi:S-adenosylmethionine--2-demethylmenaquinone methyltransferase [Arcobacter sp. CECT 8985]|uniref:RraA family protein n=1 Tax=Arcobacter sp. CECT 8985 TaxID=1935424 RepID=UPI00100BB9DB|nr:S-adenosylmethionine--2-demethylmenaquinone methyltransferase [Arcobacter sp. CECT 8985]RXJ86743.1 S-adenosylmethionine--2-demethylmenaquinone methyltransferase [Arcobacter sp. CECT 8985]
MSFFTADICDNNPQKVNVLGPDFKSYGGLNKAYGEIITVKLDKNNNDLIKLLKNINGEGKVVVVDVQMQYYAVVGDKLTKFAYDNKYNALVINGYVRDIQNIKKFDIAIYAKGTCPRKYEKVQAGKIACDLNIDNVDIQNGDYIYIDSDGIVIAKENLI